MRCIRSSLVSSCASFITLPHSSSDPAMNLSMFIRTNQETCDRGRNFSDYSEISVGRYDERLKYREDECICAPVTALVMRLCGCVVDVKVNTFIRIRCLRSADVIDNNNNNI